MFPGSVTKFFSRKFTLLVTLLWSPELVPYPHGSQTFQLTAHLNRQRERPLSSSTLPCLTFRQWTWWYVKIRHGQSHQNGSGTAVPQEQKKNLTGTLVDILMQEKELPKMRANPRTGLGCTTTCLFRKLWRLPLFISEHIHWYLF